MWVTIKSMHDYEEKKDRIVNIIESYFLGSR